MKNTKLLLFIGLGLALGGCASRPSSQAEAIILPGPQIGAADSAAAGVLSRKKP